MAAVIVSVIALPLITIIILADVDNHVVSALPPIQNALDLVGQDTLDSRSLHHVINTIHRLHTGLAMQ